jgi:hypothetical protein
VPALPYTPRHHQQTHSLEMTVAELHVKRSFTPAATLAPSLVSCKSSESVAATTCTTLRLLHAPDRGDTREWPQLRTYGLTLQTEAVRQHLAPPARRDSAPNCDIASGTQRATRICTAPCKVCMPAILTGVRFACGVCPQISTQLQPVFRHPPRKPVRSQPAVGGAGCQDAHVHLQLVVSNNRLCTAHVSTQCGCDLHARSLALTCSQRCQEPPGCPLPSW